MIGDDPLVDGLRISLRMRRDFLVTDAAAVLAEGRRAFLERYPDATSADAEAHITCAADAVYEILDRTNPMLFEELAVGLASRGGRAQITFNDPNPMSYPRNCLDGGNDVFALPPDERP